jgi:hypothetical protein
MGTGLTDGATAPPEVMDLREFWSTSQIPTLFPHRSPVNSHALTSAEGLLADDKDTGDSDDVYLEGEASRVGWLRALDLKQLPTESYLRGLMFWVEIWRRAWKFSLGGRSVDHLE